MSWDELGDAEHWTIGFASARIRSARCWPKHPWLVVCERIAQRRASSTGNWTSRRCSPAVASTCRSATRRGCDRARTSTRCSPRVTRGGSSLSKPTQAQVAAKRSEHPRTSRHDGLGRRRHGGCVVNGAFVGAPEQYPHLAGLQPDLYRCFMERRGDTARREACSALIHPESHFTDEKAGSCVRELYCGSAATGSSSTNFSLFEIKDRKFYRHHVLRSRAGTQRSLRQVRSTTPTLSLRSLVHDGSGPEPGLKDDDGNWDLRPHGSRITHVTDETLRAWHATMESDDVPIRQTRMVYAVNRSSAAVLKKLRQSPRIGELDLRFSPGWHEKNDRTKGYFESRVGGAGNPGTT